MNRSLTLVAASATLMVVLGGCSGDVKEISKMGGDAAQSMTDAAKNAAGEMGADMSVMMGKATEALASVEGGSEMLKQVTELFGKATSTFTAIKDEASANSALPELSKLTESFGGMSEKFGALPDAAKTAIAGIFQSSIGQLKPILEKVMAIPGVEAILKPAVEALMGKLEAFKA